MIGVLELKGVNVDKWEADFSRFQSELSYKAIKRAAKEIRYIFEKAEKELFETEGRSGRHSKWPPLSEKYKLWKDKNYPGRPILVLKGRLKKSLAQITPDTINTTSKFGDKWIINMGTTVEYAEYHQKGIRSGTGRKVRRPIDPSDEVARLMIRAVQREVTKAAKISGVFDNIYEDALARMDRLN